MKTLVKISASLIVSLFLLSVFSVVSAQSVGCNPNASPSQATKLTPLMQCGGTGQPCCDFNEAAILVNRIINWFLSIAVVVAAITFSVAGANILLNPDNPSKRSEAWAMFRKTVWGIVIILLAWLVINTLVKTLVNTGVDATRFLKS